LPLIRIARQSFNEGEPLCHLLVAISERKSKNQFPEKISKREFQLSASLKNQYLIPCF
jgi:hypothetical protein